MSSPIMRATSGSPPSVDNSVTTRAFFRGPIELRPEFLVHVVVDRTAEQNGGRVEILRYQFRHERSFWRQTANVTSPAVQQIADQSDAADFFPLKRETSRKEVSLPQKQ